MGTDTDRAPLYEERIDTGRAQHHVELFRDRSERDRDFLSYRLSTDGQVVWEGDEFSPSPLTDPASTEAAAELLAWLALRPGDTDAEFFADHTPEQLAWLDVHADDLVVHADQVENGPYECGAEIDVQFPGVDGTPRWGRGFVRDIGRLPDDADWTVPSPEGDGRGPAKWRVEVNVPILDGGEGATVVRLCGHDGHGDDFAPGGVHYPPPFDGPDAALFLESHGFGSAGEWVEAVREHRGGTLTPEDVETLPEHAAHIYGRDQVRDVVHGTPPSMQM